MSLPAAFQHSTTREPHHDRTVAILKQHPSVRRLVGHNPYTFLFIAGLVAVQVGIAAWASGRAWWVAVFTAYVAGAFLTHGLYVLMHECNHNLVFRRRRLNSVAGIVANLPSVLPSSVSFQRYHLKHHAFQGVYELDGDLPSRWEARLVGHSALGKALWMLLFPVSLALRPAHLREMKHVCVWTVANFVALAAFDAAIYALFGPKALLYLFASMWFALGLHPVGARWIQEHYVFHPPQETYSYYGPLNRVAFNIGYHNEHHDFPTVPWNRVPQVRAIAREWYDGLAAHTSWSRLLWRFIFDPTISLHSRVDRRDRGIDPYARFA